MRELDIKAEIEVSAGSPVSCLQPFRSRFLLFVRARHAFVGDHMARLRRNGLIDGHGELAAIKGRYCSRSSLQRFEEGNFLGQKEVITDASIFAIGSLTEFDDQVGGVKIWGFVSFARKFELCFV